MKTNHFLSFVFLLSFFFSSHLHAECCEDFENETESSWSLGASLGFASTPYMEAHQGQGALANLNFQYEFTQLGPFKVGFELGMQNGNQMRFAIEKESIDLLGGVPITGTLKPAFFTLLSLKLPLSDLYSTYLVTRAGGAYQQLQMDRESIPDLSGINPMLQAGIGVNIREKLSLSLLYQNIFGGNPDFKVNILEETGKMAAIPGQQALLLEFRVFF